MKDITENPPEEVESTFEQPAQGLSPTGISAMQGMDSPSSATPALVTDETSSTEEQVVLALQQQEALQPEIWDQLNDAQRLQALQTVEQTASAIQKRPAADVTSYTANPGEFGYYAPSENQIKIGSYSLQNEGVQENVDTIIHEGRHAYQHYSINHPGFHPNPEEVEAWKENMKPGNYLSAQEYGQEIYQSQPVEADAWQYGNTIASSIYRGVYE